jgi:hypothetical protein
VSCEARWRHRASVETAAANGKTARLWDTAPGADRSRVFDFRHLATVGAVTFSPSGRHFAVGLGNGLLAILRAPPDRTR